MSEFQILVRDMRAAQKRYFKGRKQSDLEASRVLESAVDRALEDLNHPVLFDQSGKHRVGVPHF